MPSFNLSSIPDQTGKIAIITGANTGLGFETTVALAAKKIKIIMACRDMDKAETAKNKVLKENRKADLVPMELDLANLKSVRNFASNFQQEYDQLDLLINNAGLMMPPYQKTENDLELQFQVNYLSHFLLTGLLIEQLTKTSNSRIINLSSIAHKNANIDFDDLQSEKDYSKFKAYGQSKLACLIFTKELHRRLRVKGFQNTMALAAHPGVSTTELMRHLPTWLTMITKPLELLITHAPKKAAQPTILAALSANVQSGNYFGPNGFREMKGEPAEADVSAKAKNEETAKRLWKTSEELAAINYL